MTPYPPMMRCPVCRADNTEGPQCRRCRADLSLLLALEEQRRHALALARQAAALGDGPQTLRHARASHRLRAAEDSWRLLAVGHLLSRQYADAWRCYRAAASRESV